LKKSWVKSVLPVQTNIVVAILSEDVDQMKLVTKLAEQGILCVPFGKGRIRFTTHLEITQDSIDYLDKNLPDLV